MKILYDHQAFTMQHLGGVSRSLCSVMENLPQDIKVDVGASQCNNVYLLESGIVPDLKRASLDWVESRKRFYFPGKRTLFQMASRLGLIHSAEYFNNKCSINKLRKRDFDVFHPTFFDDYFLRYLGEKPFVLTVHDMMPELFPQYFKASDSQIQGKRRLIKHASAIAVPSMNTKKDLVELLDVSPERVSIIYWGGPERELVLRDSIIKDPYFLFVGTRGAYKNFIGLLKDYQLFHQKVPDVKLVCVGAPFTPGEEEMIQSMGLKDIVVRTAADDNQLKNLYAHSLAFIFPSRYEGFGLPVLEAMAYGCPLLLNNRSCFPEVAGDAALYFNSDGDVSELPELMRQVLSWDDETRTAVIEKGYERLKRFSWEKAASEYAELYRSLL